MEKQGRMYSTPDEEAANIVCLWVNMDDVPRQRIVCVYFMISLHVVWSWRSFYSPISKCITYLVLEDVRVLI